MAEHEHHHDPIEDNIDAHPVKLAIGVVIGAAALIVGIVLLAQFAVGSHGSRSMQGDPAMSDAEVAKRLAPAARLVVDPAASAAAATPAPAVASVTIPPAAGKAPSPAAGKATFDAACIVCHGAGVAGAPKLADKAAWAPRIKTGIEALHASALKGKGAMPPKGGNLALADADVKAAVDYMVAAAK
jgi:cytochrome c5